MATSHGNEHGTTAHTAAEGGHGGFPPFDSSTFASQLVWFAITFVALYIIVSRIALPRVGGIIASRRSTIDSELAEAQRHKDESDKAVAAYEAELAQARSRAQTIATETRDRLNAEAESARKTLDAELAGKMTAAEAAIASTRKAAMANVSGIAVDTAAAIVQQLTGSAPDAKTVQAAVDSVVKG